MNLYKNKRCPRCNTKVPYGTGVCPSCMLNFQKFDEATNKEAKQAIKQGEKDRVLMRKGCPNDVNKIKLLIITLLCGMTGAHLYYVGRYKLGIFYSIFFAVGIINAILTTFLNNALHGTWYDIFTILVLVWGAVICMWLIDLFKIVINKFKIPVSRS